MKHLYTLLCAMLAFSAHAQIKNVTDIRPNAASSNPFWLKQFKGRLSYMADSASSGIELYHTNNIDETKRGAQINPGGGGPTLNRNSGMIEFDGRLMFAHCKTSGAPETIFRWDGVWPPEALVDLGANTTNPAFLTEAYNDLYFIRFYNHAAQYGTEIVYLSLSIGASDHVVLPATGEKYHNMTSYKNRVYVSASNTATDGNIYQLDPFNTPPKAPLPGSNIRYYAPKSIHEIGDYLYYTSQDSGAAARHSIYFWDGIYVRKVTSDTLGPKMNVRFDFYKNLGKLKDSIYFAAVDSGESFPKLYKSYYDKFEDTFALTEVYQFNKVTAKIGNFFTLRDTMYFTAGDTLHGQELWMYDGIHAPSMVYDLNPGTADANPVELTMYADNLYFVATEPGRGTEIFRLPGGTNVAERSKSISDTKAYPNPAHSELTLEFTLLHPAQLHVQLIDMAGKVVYSAACPGGEPGHHTHRITTSQLAPGTYTYRITDKTNTAYGSGKFVKQ